MRHVLRVLLKTASMTIGRMVGILCCAWMLLVLPSCDILPGDPCDLLPPDIPCPFEPAPPGEAYDCDDPESLTGKYFKAEGASEDRIIVVLRPGASRGASQVLDRVQSLTSKYGVQTNAIERLHTTPLRLTLRVNADLMKVVTLLLSDPDVRYVSHENTFSISPLVVDRAADSWGIDRLDQRALPLDGEYEPGAGGTGIHVAIIDTGIGTDPDGTDTNPEFAGRLTAPCFTAHSFRGCADGHGHGTHVAGTVGGVQWGVAKDVFLHSVRVLNEQGSGTTSEVIAGVDQVAAWAQESGEVWLANMSLGGPPDPPLDEAVCRALRAGVAFGIAAGNDYGDDPANSSPARVKQILTVSASDRDDRAADFSNLGTLTDVWGPGVDIVSERPDGGSATFSGTSMATPHVVGTMALCLQRHPGLDAAGVMQCVVDNATEGALSGVGEDAPNLLVYAKEDSP